MRSIMREEGLEPCQPRPFRPVTTIAGDAGDLPDLLERDFTATEPGTKLVGDITYIPVRTRRVPSTVPNLAPLSCSRGEGWGAPGRVWSADENADKTQGLPTAERRAHHGHSN